jgi:hypothetical protein
MTTWTPETKNSASWTAVTKSGGGYFNLLLENGDKVLLESGSKMLLEQTSSVVWVAETKH